MCSKPALYRQLDHHPYPYRSLLTSLRRISREERMWSDPAPRSFEISVQQRQSGSRSLQVFGMPSSPRCIPCNEHAEQACSSLLGAIRITTRQRQSQI
ncbi:hypothetical protein M3J09_012691 [Ascochyta lentis]